MRLSWSYPRVKAMHIQGLHETVMVIAKGMHIQGLHETVMVISKGQGHAYPRAA